jgi:hypothetical protein
MSQIGTQGAAIVAAVIGQVADTTFSLTPIDTVEALTAQAVRVIPVGAEKRRQDKCGEFRLSFNAYVYTPLRGALTEESHYTAIEGVMSDLDGLNPRTIITASFMEWEAVKGAQVCVTVIQISF